MTQTDKTILAPEKTDLKLGLIALTDSCVLAIAKEKGFFKNQGLTVELSKEASWANIRDKVCVGALDGAQMLAGMPIATTLGLGFTRKPMLTAFSMDLNGNGITVSNALYERLVAINSDIVSKPKISAKVLKQLIDKDKAENKPPLTFAMVYPYSTHNYEIRYWMASAGIDPDKDIHLRVIPPQYMVSNLEAGQIDGFCIGGPWNSLAVDQGLGHMIISGYDIWNNSPEKVLGVTQEWANKYPNTHLCLIRALMETVIWIEQPEHHDETATILADDKYIGVPKEVIKLSLQGDFNTEAYSMSVPDYIVFNRYLSNFPWCSHASWLITQMYRWGQLEEAIDIRKIAELIYRPDIYRQAASQLGLSFPSINYKTEGEHAEAWSLIDNDEKFNMGADQFLDEKIFNPDELVNYLSNFELKRLKVELETLAKDNQ